MAWFAAQTDAQEASPYAAVGGDFTLLSAEGPVSLGDYRGKVVLLAFGYASCPDVCPITLATSAAAMRMLPAEDAAQVAGLFVSVDPERDGPAQASAYASFFHPAIVGLSGDPEAIAAVARQYLVTYERVDAPESALRYTVDHTTTTYLIGPGGQVRGLLRHGEAAVDIALALQAALRGEYRKLHG